MQTEIQKFVSRMIPRMYRVINLMLDDMEREHAPMPKGPLVPVAATVWRWANDEFGFWRLCSTRRCRRARRCCGEPRACLDRHLESVPQAARDRVRAGLRARFTAAASQYKSRHAAGFSTIKLPSSSTDSPVPRTSPSSDGCQSTLPASGPPTIAISSASGRSLRLRKPR